MFFLLCAVAFTKIANAQNLVYDANAEVRKVGNFTGVDVSGGINLYLSQGTEQAVAVSASDEKFIPKIKTEVKNGVLRISLENGFWNGWNFGNKKVKAYVTVTELNSLEGSGGSLIRAADPIKVSDLNADMGGGSILEGDFTGNHLNIEVSGGSIAKLKGKFDEVNIDASGGSIFKDYELISNSCNVDASGGSIINVTVNKELKADASGGSIIRYKGTGAITGVDTSGGASIKKQDD